jgi:molybdenum cofactor cytidylyltransferase
MNLVDAIQPTLPTRIAIVGGGGKTTAMFMLARQLPGPVWTTTTTHLGTDQLDLTDQHFIISGPEEIDIPRLKSKRTTLITGLFTPDDRVKGPEPDVMNEVVRIADQEAVSLVVEADGARSHPIKAPAEHEPVIPAWATTVIVVVGLSVLGKPLSSEWVHRAERFEALTGLQQGQPVSLDAIAAMLVSPMGGLKGIPKGARIIALLNQTEDEQTSQMAVSMVKTILDGGFDTVVIGSLKNSPDFLQAYKRI